MFYLATANVVFTQNKPPTAVSRTLQTQNFAADTRKHSKHPLMRYKIWIIQSMYLILMLV